MWLNLLCHTFFQCLFRPTIRGTTRLTFLRLRTPPMWLHNPGPPGPKRKPPCTGHLQWWPLGPRVGGLGILTCPEPLNQNFEGH